MTDKSKSHDSSLPELPEDLTYETACIRLTQALMRAGLQNDPGTKFREVISVKDDKECFRELCRLAEKERLNIKNVIRSPNCNADKLLAGVISEKSIDERNRHAFYTAIKMAKYKGCDMLSLVKKMKDADICEQITFICKTAGLSEEEVRKQFIPGTADALATRVLDTLLL